MQLAFCVLGIKKRKKEFAQTRIWHENSLNKYESTRLKKTKSLIVNELFLSPNPSKEKSAPFSPSQAPRFSAAFDPHIIYK